MNFNLNTFLLIFCIFTFGCSSKIILGKKPNPGRSIKAGKTIVVDLPKVKTNFIDRTLDYGLENIQAYNINIIDINRDGYSDIVILPSFYSQPVFYYFDKKQMKFFKGISPFTSGVKASYLLFYDFNKDGHLDVVVGVLNQKTEMSSEPLRIFYGKSGVGGLKFDEPIKIYNPTPNSSVGLIDYNLDGELDFYLGNWFLTSKDKITLPRADILLESSKKSKSKFLDRTDRLLGENKMNPDKLMYINAAPTYGVQICDMDQNGYPDILTTSTNNYANKLWMNKFKIRDAYRYFQDYGRSSSFGGDLEGNLNSRGGGRTFGVACADYNNDGIMDVFLGELTHNYDNDGIDKSSLLTGAKLKFPPEFLRTEYFLDDMDIDWHQADRRGIWFDYNNDGLLDLLVDNSGYPPHTKMILFKQELDHSFTNTAKLEGLDLINPISSVIADFNKDGKLDILTAQSNIRDARLKNRLILYENNMDMQNRKSIRFTLRGRESNYHGLNAMIVLKIKTASGFVHRRQMVSYSYGALSPQNEEGVHFGLSEGEIPVKVMVRWPFAAAGKQDRSHMEKFYEIKINYKNSIDITLCESGVLLVGKKECE